MQSRFPWRPAAALGLAALLAGCATDPFQRPGTWRAADDNAHNLGLMVADPADLEHGHGTETSLGASAATAIGRMRADKLKPLPSDMESFQVGGTDGATAQP